jgi:hypothetical protein
MTSIEYLFNELWEAPKDKLTWHSILKKAKEMHKQEMATNCSQQEISDEEIEEAGERLVDDEYEFNAFIIGAKWYREQLKNKKDEK